MQMMQLQLVKARPHNVLHSSSNYVCTDSFDNTLHNKATRILLG